MNPTILGLEGQGFLIRFLKKKGTPLKEVSESRDSILLEAPWGLVKCFEGSRA